MHAAERLSRLVIPAIARGGEGYWRRCQTALVARREPREHDDELRRVYRAHVRAVYAFFAYSVSREQAEDLTATTFERVIRAWKSFDPARASERTWILTIARNALIDHFRRKKELVSTDAHPALLETLADFDDPLTRLMSAEGLTDWLRQSGERDRQALALRFGADLSAREVADAMDLTEANVHQIISRALRRLRDLAASQATDTDASPS